MPTLTRETSPSSGASGTPSSPGGAAHPGDARGPPATDAAAPSRPASAPSPPAGVPEIQLQMWKVVLKRRTRQMQRLPRRYLRGFANDVVSDLAASKHETNQYSEGLKGADEKENSENGSNLDLTSGHYSTLLLTQLPAEVTADALGLHFLALFYRSVDVRLPLAMRKHGIDAVRRACGKLDVWRAKWESERGSDDAGPKDASDGAGSEDRKRKDMDGSGKDGAAGSSQPGTEGSAMNRSGGDGDGSNKRMRREAPASNDAPAANAPAANAPAANAPLTAQGSGQVPSHGVGETKDAAGKRKDPPRGLSEPDPNAKSTSAPSQPLHGAREKGSEGPASQESAQQASRVAHSKASDGEKRAKPHEQNQSKDRASRGTEEKGLGKRFVPPAQAQRRNSGSSLGKATEPASGQSVPQNTSHIAGAATPSQKSRWGPSKGTEEPQRKDPPEFMQAAATASNVSGGDQSAGKATYANTQAETQQRKSPEKQSATVVSKVSENEEGEKATSSSVLPRKDGNTAPQKQGAATVERTQAKNVESGSEAAKAPAPADSTAPASKTSRAPEVPQAPKPGKETAATANAKSTACDLIDLTGDDSPPNTPPVEADAPSIPASAIKQNDEEMTEAATVTQKRPPSPASPLPFATIHSPAPPPQSKPKPFSEMRKIIFQADSRNPPASGSLKGRPSCALSYDAGYHLDGSGSCLDNAHCIEVGERLKKWDPYWKIVEELGSRKVSSAQGHHKMTTVGVRTTLCELAQGSGPATPEHPKSCASVFIDLPREVSRSELSNRDSSGKLLPAGYHPWGCKWGSPSHPYMDERGRQKDRFETGDRRLIVRTLPLQRSPKDATKRADMHLWPKGTFLQLSRGTGERVITSVQQRKQQSHEPKEWKGISHPLDLTKEVVNTGMPIELKLCSVESLSANEAANGILTGSYALHVAICEYIDADDLYDQLMGKTPGEVTIPKISLKSAKKIAMEYMAGQTVVVDSDDEAGTAHGTSGGHQDRSLTFSLICPIMKTAMVTPVRGRHCKHIQCFDLKNFLLTNKNVTGGRWRCGACESFVNVQDLVHCGLFQAMVDSLGSQVSGARDKVSLRSDGTWQLMDENKLRYAKRGGATAAHKAEAKSSEVIELE